MPKRIPTHRNKHQQSRIEKRRQYDKHRNDKYPWRKWYNLQAWRNLRAEVLAKDPFCVLCLSEGIATPSTVADHIIPHKGDEALFWDKSNIRGVCKPHHDSDIQSDEHAGGYHK